VLFVSLHQFPFYPGTGDVDETGVDAGLGATLNLPLPAGCGDASYLAAFDAIVLPVLHAFRPEALLVSAGFDAHERDPLGQMRVSTRGFAAMAARLRDAADALCGGRLALLLEGGYDAEALGASVAAVLGVLCGETPDRACAPATAGPEWDRVALLRDVHATHWKCLRATPSS
jgi:acetoin utilization deacetylase AcuC-like enzyme